MKKNNKVSFGLLLGAVVSALVAIFMGFAKVIVGKNSSEGYKFFDYIFTKGDLKGMDFHYNWLYIVAFVLLILAICALVALVVMKLTKKENKKLELAMVIVAIVALVIWAVLAFCGKAVMVGEIKKMYPDMPEIAESFKQNCKLGAGAIVAGIFGILGAGCALGAHLTKE